jgi:hypothetical protein
MVGRVWPRHSGGGRPLNSVVRRHVPYEIAFSKVLVPPGNHDYINDCCFGGDVVSNWLLPEISKRYEQIQHDQEDWGWFIWIKSPNVSLAVDIFCDDPVSGEFRIHLTSRKRRLLLPDVVADTPELDELKHLVISEVEKWAGACRTERIAE